MRAEREFIPANRAAFQTWEKNSQSHHIEAAGNAEKPCHECGVFGIYFPHADIQNKIALLTFTGLLENQHRGEESAGIAVANDHGISRVFKRQGLVKNAHRQFVEGGYSKDPEYFGHIGIGHTRYSTTGGSHEINAGPFKAESESLGEIAVAHNGNITNAIDLKRELYNTGVHFKSTTDSEVIGELIARSPGDTWEDKISAALRRLEGSFSLVMTTKDALWAARDTIGNRPLSFAAFEKDGVAGYAVSSETPAFDELDIAYQREIKRGELIRFDNTGIISAEYKKPDVEAFCGMEIAYMMRPDSRVNREQLDGLRRKLGARLAHEAPVEDDIDFVTYIPTSSISSAEGYAEELSEIFGRFIPCRAGMMKKRYGSIRADGTDGGQRGFLQPDQAQRKVVADKNYKPFDWIIGKNVVLIDDSIVRGTTTEGAIRTIQEKVGMLQNMGAGSIDVRIVYPEIVSFCPLGTDISAQDRLFALDNPTSESKAKALDVRSVAHLTVASFRSEVEANTDKKLCMGCADKIYPVSVEKFKSDKLALEVV